MSNNDFDSRFFFFQEKIEKLEIKLLGLVFLSLDKTFNVFLRYSENEIDEE